MKTYLNVVECAIEHNGKFLVIKRPPGVHAGDLLSFPGGKVDENDEKNEWDILRSAVKREILEEVGLDLKDKLHYITSNTFIDSDNMPVIDTLFYCKVTDTKLTVVPSSREVPEYYWLTLHEINNAPNTPPWLKQYLRFIEAWSQKCPH